MKSHGAYSAILYREAALPRWKNQLGTCWDVDSTNGGQGTGTKCTSFLSTTQFPTSYLPALDAW